MGSPRRWSLISGHGSGGISRNSSSASAECTPVTRYEPSSAGRSSGAFDPSDTPPIQANASGTVERCPTTSSATSEEFSCQSSTMKQTSPAGNPKAVELASDVTHRSLPLLLSLHPGLVDSISEEPSGMRQRSSATGSSPRRRPELDPTRLGQLAHHRLVVRHVFDATEVRTGREEKDAVVGATHSGVDDGPDPGRHIRVNEVDRRATTSTSLRHHYRFGLSAQIACSIEVHGQEQVEHLPITLRWRPVHSPLHDRSISPARHWGADRSAGRLPRTVDL